LRLPNFCLLFALAAIATLAACTNGAPPAPPLLAECTDQILDPNFNNNYRSVIGLGEGAYAAEHLFFKQPGRFNVLLALNGPTSATSEIAQLQHFAETFDNWPSAVSRSEWIRRMRDKIAAFGNPFYNNPNSNFYPPGLTAADFAGANPQPKRLPPFIDQYDPTGKYPCVSIIDKSGEPVDFWIAHDLHNSGRYEAGDPIAMLPYTPATWSSYDPTTLAQTALLNIDPGYVESIYLDELTDDPLGYNAQIDALATILEKRLAPANKSLARYCIQSRFGRYDGPAWDVPILTKQIWWPQKYVLFDLPGSSLNTWGDAQTALRTGRFSQALRFSSLRLPNGQFDAGYDDTPYTEAVWEVTQFYSHTLGRYQQFGIGYPAGYFNVKTAWKTYPVVYFFHDRDGNVNDGSELLARQADLAIRQFAKQAILIVIDGTRAEDNLSGFNYYVNQAAPEFGGSYGDAVEELIEYVEASYRVQFGVEHR